MGKGSPAPSPNHDLRNSGEGKTANSDFQGYLNTVWPWWFYYLCQFSAVDNSLTRTLILAFEYFGIKSKKNSLSGWLGAGRPNTAPVPFWSPSWRPSHSYPIALKLQSAHMLKQPNLTM